MHPNAEMDWDKDPSAQQPLALRGFLALSEELLDTASTRLNYVPQTVAIMPQLPVVEGNPAS